MLYRLQEGTLPLPSDLQQDKTVNVLIPAGLSEGANLVVTRDQLAPGMDFKAYVAKQLKFLSRELKDFTLLRDKPIEIDRHPAHLLEFTRTDKGRFLYQAGLMVQDGDDLLNFTASVPGGDEATQLVLLQMIAGFRFAVEETAA